MTVRDGWTIPSSFRDPSGFVFLRQGELLRQVNRAYKEHYDCLESSGLHQRLVSAGWLLPHQESALSYAQSPQAYKVLRPERVEMITHPYEWCFSQLRDAALVTLRIQQEALDAGMILKDASAYNIQFHNGCPVFIDTLSFEKYREGEPWVAYRQFCQHFLAPLALMKYTDVRLGKMSQLFLDGCPLDLASRLLPVRSRLRFSLLLHIHLHARSQKRYSDISLDRAKLRGKMPRRSMLGLIDNLRRTVTGLQWRPRDRQWLDYYQTASNYTDAGLAHKEVLVAEFLDRIESRLVWDLGANTGRFSRIAARTADRVVAFDSDHAAVEANYREIREKDERRILPLLLDFTNPSPRIGWRNEERTSIFDRSSPDTVLALALIHHLAIANNLPLRQLAGFFGSLCRYLICEFVPKTDSQAQRLLASREDVFPHYSQESFEDEFTSEFRIHRAERIRESERTLYLMEKRGPTE